MPDPEESAAAVLALRLGIFYDTLERQRRSYEALAIQAYQAAGSPYRGQLGALPGALLWLQEQADRQALPQRDWLRCWHRFLGELRRDGVVSREGIVATGAREADHEH